MHFIGNASYSLDDDPVPLYECDTCGCAVSDPDLHKSYTHHDKEH